MEQQGCLICLVADPPPIPHIFSCGCSALVHKRCLVEWFSKSETTCLYCRKPIQANLPTPTQVVPAAELIYVEMPIVLTRPVVNYPSPTRTRLSLRGICQPVSLCKFALIFVCISLIIGGVVWGARFIPIPLVVND